MRLRVKFAFEAGHRLSKYNGDCFKIHGHSYIVNLEIKGEIQESGFVTDFKNIKRSLVDRVMNWLDHGFIISEDDKLFDYREWVQKNMKVIILKNAKDATVESITTAIVNELKRVCKMYPEFDVSRLEVFETEKCSAVWVEGDKLEDITFRAHIYGVDGNPTFFTKPKMEIKDVKHQK